MLSPARSVSPIPAVLPKVGPASEPAAPAAAPATADAPSPAEQLIATRMTSAGVLENIRALTTVPRPGASDAYRERAAWVVEQAKAAGWDAKIVEAKGSGGWGGSGPSFNVVADRKGTAPDAERKLVIGGAHLDSVHGAPGANDNASGSGMLIEFAESLKGIDTKNDLRLLWFDREEQGLIGSLAYARDNAAELKRAVVMLNADMVGSQNGDVGYSVGARTSRAVGDAIKGVAERNQVLSVFREERHARSDHESFDRAGVPTADFGVSVRTVHKDDPYYHTPKDTVDKINPAVLEGMSDLFGLSMYHFAGTSDRLTEPKAPRPIRPITGPPL